jgi:hypothetical protein
MRGRKVRWRKVKTALTKELNQLLQWEALLPMKREDMSHEEKKKALQYLMFLKERQYQGKRMGKWQVTEVTYNKIVQ